MPKARDPVLFRGKEKPDPFNRAALGTPEKPEVSLEDAAELRRLKIIQENEAYAHVGECWGGLE